MTSKKKKYVPNHVTLYTDASWAQDIGSWAFWARSDHGRHMLSAVVPKGITNINSAETYAICQGMYKCLQKWPKTEGFFVFSDSLSAINLLRGGNSKSDILNRLKDSFDKMVKEHDLKVTLRHVKAHKNPNKSTRNWLNNWCDESAKKSRKKHEKEIKSKADCTDAGPAQGVGQEDAREHQKFK